MAPIDGDITVGLWAGAGYTIITTTSTELTITQKISGGLSGGFSGTPVIAEDVAPNTNLTITPPPSGNAGQVPNLINPAPSQGNPTVNELIDAVTGAEVYTHSDLVIGRERSPTLCPSRETSSMSAWATDGRIATA